MSVDGSEDLRPPLVAISERVRAGTRDVAEEGNRWFLRAVGWSVLGASEVGNRMTGGLRRLRERLPGASTRARLRRALVTEARGSALDPDAAEFQAFAENVSTLIELVLAGRIRLEDVGFAFEGVDGEEAAPDEGAYDPGG